MITRNKCNFALIHYSHPNSGTSTFSKPLYFLVLPNKNRFPSQYFISLTLQELQVKVADTSWSEKSGHAAIFDKDVYEVETSETSPPHSVVFRLTRPDAAVGLSISSGNEGEDFILEEKSGVLYTNKWLDAETKSTYTLTIDSHDRRPSGDFYRRRQSVAKIIVKVLDGERRNPGIINVALLMPH